MLTTILLTLCSIILINKLNIFNFPVRFIISKLLKLNIELTKNIKPFNCALCFSFWLVLINLLITSTLPIIITFSIALINAYSTPVYEKIMDIVYDTIVLILIKINRKIK